MIKWLKGIQVTSQEFEGDYHYHDNRLLPSDVDAKKATAEGWLAFNQVDFGWGELLIACLGDWLKIPCWFLFIGGSSSLFVSVEIILSVRP